LIFFILFFFSNVFSDNLILKHKAALSLLLECISCNTQRQIF